MRRTYKKTLTFLLVTFTSLSLFAQNNFFSKVEERSISVGTAKRLITPERYNLVEITPQNLRNFLWSLPDEKDVINRANAPIMTLPMPDGSTARFRVWHSSIQEAGAEVKFPDIKTFAGQGMDDPYATIRMDYSPYFGFHAQVLSVNGRIYIDPYARGNINYYQSYYHADNKRVANFECNTVADIVEKTETAVANKTLAGPCRGTQLYTYRLAVACTGEYANAVGAAGNASALHSAIVTSVNRVTGIYEKELAIRLILISNNNQIEYLDPTTDPFNGNNNGGVLIGESQTVITNNIGSGGFDIGHTFSTGGGGIAGLGVVCNTNNKARGITGSPQPFGDGYDVDYVSHEMGHQFGGSHTFNSVNGSCGGNRSASAAYEVGSGTTIQGYAGICSGDNIQPNSDPFFHAFSFDQISTFVEAGGTCHGTIATGNNIPQITAMDNNNVTIPIGTPFTLNATATDGDGDAISYSWEQWDLGPAGTWNSGSTSTTAPLFKARIPKATGSRTFPDMAVILAGYPANPGATMGGMKGETLPQVARVMKFKLTVRDNRAGGGGVTSGGDGCQAGFTSIYQVNVSGTTPFTVVFPNGGESFGGGSTQTVTWNNAGTDQAPFNTPNVKISLSTDGGLTYPTVLVASTPNDGSENVNLPVIGTTTARVKVEGVNNVFFDISNSNFSISGGPTFDFGVTSPGTVTCGGATSASVTLPTSATLGFSTPINLSASGNPAGTTVSFSPNPLTPGSSTTVTLNGVNTLATGTYIVTVTGTAGSQTKTKDVQFIVQPGAGPAITSHPSNVSICASGNATFSVVSPTATSYQWQVSTDGMNFINLSGETGSSVTIGSVSPSQNGNWYRAVVFGPCNSSVSNAGMLTVTPKPDVTITATQTSLLPGQSTTLTANPTPAGNYTYIWTLNGTPIPGATGSTYTANVTGAGDYVVNVVETGTGCNNQSAALRITATPSNNLFIFPNPNNGKFNIALYYSGTSTTQRTATIYDTRGALVYSRTVNINTPYHLIDVNMIFAAQGAYLVVIRDKDGKKLATGTVLIGQH